MAKATPHSGEGWDRLERLVLELQNRSADGFATGADQISKAHGLLDAVRKSFSAQGETAAQTVKDIMGAVQELRKATIESEELQAKLSGLAGQLAERDESITTQKEAALQFEKRLAEQDQALQASKQRVVELERQAKESQEALESERSEKATLRQQLEEFENTANARNADLEQGKKRSEELSLLLSQKDEELAGLRNRIELIEREKAEVKSALSAQKSELDKVRSELEAVKANKKVADGEVASLKKEMAGARTEAAKLREELGKAAESSGRIATLEAALKAANERTELLDRRLKAEMADVAKASSVVAQLASAVKDKNEPGKPSVNVNDAETQEEALILEAAPATPVSPATPTLPESDGRRWKLGEILWEMGVITLEQLEDALEEQRLNPQMKIGTILQEKGYASPEAVAQAVALRAETEYVEVDAESIAPEVASLIPARLAALHKCIPIRANEESVTLAMANALDIVAIEDVERVSQRRVEPVVATEPRVLELIEQVYEQSPASRK